MLGFRYYKQSANIAHGCAMTFATLHRLRKESYAGAYRLDIEDWKPDAFLEGRLNPEFFQKLNKDGAKGKPGAYLFRSESTCPVSVEAIAAAKRGARSRETALSQRNGPGVADDSRVLQKAGDA